MNFIQTSQRVGRVVGLWRYPVKSMAGEALNQAEVSWNGLSGDRRWAFIRNDVVQNGFSWFTLRERADMAHYRPSFVQPDLPDTSATLVRSPSGLVYDVADPALGKALCPGGLRVIKQNRGIFDTFPLSLITTQTIARLGEMVCASLDVRRFRPNLVIETDDLTAFAEDSWVGSVVRIGEVRMRVDERDGRCAVITIDPDTAERNTTILRTVAQSRQGCLGVYGTTVTPGRISVGDPVIVEGTA